MRFSASFVLPFFLTACGSQGLARKHSAMPPRPNPESEVAKDCSSFEGMKSLPNTPLDHAMPDGLSFTYNYQQLGEDDSKLTIFFLPGGPGQDSIGNEITDRAQAKSYNFVYIDPRGVGCNYPGTESISPELLTTSQYAQDVLRVIEAVKPKKYVIYGVSYGTVIGTVLASAAEKSDYKPHAVVLEGVLSSAFTKTNRQEFDIQWNKVVQEHENIRQAFAKPEKPLGLGEEAWLSYIQTLLYFGNDILAEALKDVLTATDEAEIAELKDQISSTSENQKSVQGTSRFFKTVGGREIFSPYLDDEVVITRIQDGLQHSFKYEHIAHIFADYNIYLYILFA